MKYFLIAVGFALQLTSPFLKQTCTRNSFFSLQIDNHFNEPILFANVTSPDFLRVSERSISAENTAKLALDFAVKIIDLAVFKNFLIVSELSGLYVYDLRMRSNPKLVQYFRDFIFEDKLLVRTGDLIVLFNKHQVFAMEIEEKYPQIVGKYYSEEEIQALEVINDQVILFTQNGLSVLSVLDKELGEIQVTKALGTSDFGLTHLSFKGIYLANTIFALEETLGLMEISYFPLKIEKIHPFVGQTLSGYQSEYLLINSNTEISLIDFSFKTYNFSKLCEMTFIDDQFIYCKYFSRITIISRHTVIVTDFKYDEIQSVTLNNNNLFVGSKDKVTIQSVKLGPMFLQGNVPDEVEDLKVVFYVKSLSQQLSESFLLSIQYSIANVIMFILISFIGVFCLVFALSMLCRCLNREKKNPETLNILTTNRELAVPASATDRAPNSTDRSVMSDRGLIDITNRNALANRNNK